MKNQDIIKELKSSQDLSRVVQNVENFLNEKIQTDGNVKISDDELNIYNSLLEYTILHKIKHRLNSEEKVRKLRHKEVILEYFSQRNL